MSPLLLGQGNYCGTELMCRMSSESLAANGESLRRKVLFVASSLLEKYPSTTEGHNYVSDFLAVVSISSRAVLVKSSGGR